MMKKKKLYKFVPWFVPSYRRRLVVGFVVVVFTFTQSLQRHHKCVITWQQLNVVHPVGSYDL